MLKLSAGGIAKELNASDAEALLAALAPRTPVERVRHQLALELLDEVRTLDGQLKASHRRIAEAVRASKTTVTDIFGVGPIIACMAIGHSRDIRRFANRDHYAVWSAPGSACCTQAVSLTLWSDRSSTTLSVSQSTIPLWDDQGQVRLCPRGPT